MREWLRLAGSASVRRRALRMAGVVGMILLAINHGEALVRGDVSPDRLMRMILTLIVPYLVSTVSSVSAIRELQRAGEGEVGPARLLIDRRRRSAGERSA